MSYILSTAKSSTAVLGSVFGNFLGTPGRSQLILNCVNRIEIWESTATTTTGDVSDDPFINSISGSNKASSAFANLNSGVAPPLDHNSAAATKTPPQQFPSHTTDGDAAYVPPSPQFRLVCEYRVYGTIKHMLAIPLPRDLRACTESKVRMCLFLFTEKGDFSFLLMYRPVASPTSIQCVPLATFNLTNSLLKPHFNGANICTSSFEQFNVAHYGASSVINQAESNGGGGNAVVETADNDAESEISGEVSSSLQHAAFLRSCSRPVIALSHYRSTVVIIDVAACISTIPLAAISRDDPSHTTSSSKRKRRNTTVAEGEDGPASPSSSLSPDEEAAFIQQLVLCDDGQGAFTAQNCRSIVEASSFAPITFCPVDEHEPRSLCLHTTQTPLSKSSSPTSSPQPVTTYLMALYQDNRGRAHVRRYVLSHMTLRTPFWGVSAYERLSGDAASNPKGGPSAGALTHHLSSDEASESLRNVVDKSILRKSKDRVNGISLVRSILLQGDVESDAYLLHSMPNGICVIGGALVTYIDLDTTNAAHTATMAQSQVSGGANAAAMAAATGINFVCTSITPSPYARSHPVYAVTVSPISCLVGYANGTVLAVTMADLGEGGNGVSTGGASVDRTFPAASTTDDSSAAAASAASPKRRVSKKKPTKQQRDSGELTVRIASTAFNVLAEGFDVHCNVLNAYLTPMTEMVQIDKYHVLVSSGVSSSVILRLTDGSAYVARDNIGPIVDMCADSTSLVEQPSVFRTSGFQTAYYKPDRRISRPTIVAATGVDSGGCLTSITNAVHLSDRASVSGVGGVLEIFSVPSCNIIALSYVDGTQLLSLFQEPGSDPRQAASSSSMCLRELGPEVPESTLAMGTVEGGLVVWVTQSSISLCAPHDGTIEVLHKEVFNGRQATRAAVGLSVAAVACNSTVHFYDLSSLNRVTSIECGSAVACLSFISDLHGTTDEVIAGLWGSNTLALISPKSTITTIATLPSLPRSLLCTAVVPIEKSLSVNRGLFSAAASDSPAPTNSYQRLFVGNADGSISHAIMPSRGTRSSANNTKISFATMAIGTQPVSFSPVQVKRGGANVTVGVLCSGDTPAVLFDSGDSLGATGFGHAEFDSAAQLSETGDTFVLYSRADTSLSLVSINPQGYEALSKLSTPVRTTIPKLKYIPAWNSYAVVRFEENQDVLSLYSRGANGALHPRTVSSIHSSHHPSSNSGSGFSPNTFKLLESERCMFVEWVQFNGRNFVVNSDDESVCSQEPPSASTIHFRATWDPSKPFGALLIGTNFVFPNDVAPRNGRLILVALEHEEGGHGITTTTTSTTTNAAASSSSSSTHSPGKLPSHQGAGNLVQLCEQDVRGMVLSACMMPGTNCKVLVGVTGAIRVMHWSPRDKNLAPIATISVGMACTKLTPLSGGHIGATKKQMEEHTKSQLAANTVADQATNNAAEGGTTTTASNTRPPPPCLVAVGDMKNSVTVVQFNDVEMARIETREVALREIMDFVPVGSCSFHSNGEFFNRRSQQKAIDDGEDDIGNGAAYNPHFLVADADMNLVLLGNSLEPPTTTKKVPEAVQRHNAEEEADRQRREARVAIPSPGGSPLLTPATSRAPAFPPRTPTFTEGSASPRPDAAGGGSAAPRNSGDGGRGSGGSANNNNTISNTNNTRDVPPSFTGPSWTPSKLRSLDIVAQFHIGDRITTLVRGSLKVSKGVTMLTDNQRALLSESTVTSSTVAPSWTPPPRGLLPSMFEPLLAGWEGQLPSLPPSFLFGTAHGMVGSVVPLPSCVMKYLSLLEVVTTHCNPVALPCFDNENFRSTLSKDFHPNLYLNQTFNEVFDAGHAAKIVENMKRKVKSRGVVDGDVVFDLLRAGVSAEWKKLTLEEFNYVIQSSYVQGEFDGYQADLPSGRTTDFGAASASAPTLTGGTGSLSTNAMRFVRPGVRLDSDGKIIDPNDLNNQEAGDDALFSQKRVLAAIDRERRRIARQKADLRHFGSDYVTTHPIAPADTLLLPPVDIDRINTVLRAYYLPTLPVHPDSMEMFLGELQRSM